MLFAYDLEKGRSSNAWRLPSWSGRHGKLSHWKSRCQDMWGLWWLVDRRHWKQHSQLPSVLDSKKKQRVDSRGEDGCRGVPVWWADRRGLWKNYDKKWPKKRILQWFLGWFLSFFHGKCNFSHCFDCYADRKKTLPVVDLEADRADDPGGRRSTAGGTEKKKHNTNIMQKNIYMDII